MDTNVNAQCGLRSRRNEKTICDSYVTFKLHLREGDTNSSDDHTNCL